LLAGRIQDIDLGAIKMDYDVLFGNFEAADCAAGPFLDLLVLLCASDNRTCRLLAEFDKQLQLWNLYQLTSDSDDCVDLPDTRGLISSGASLFSHLLEEMPHIIQTTDEDQLQCLTIEFALPSGR
jgi:hypothetical protein